MSVGPQVFRPKHVRLITGEPLDVIGSYESSTRLKHLKLIKSCTIYP